MFITEPEREEGHFSTRSVHAGEPKEKPFGSLTMPIVQTSTYHFEDTAALIEHMERKEAGLEPLRGEYGRYGNPTQEVVERKLAALDGGERALVFASGMAAVTTTLLTFLSAGDHFVLTEDCYRKTRQFSLEVMSRLGVTCSIVPQGDYAKMEEAMRPETRLVVGETPTNPYLRVIDIPRVVEIARRHGALTLIDATFGTPYNIRPLEYGADLVVHSATKYLGGHNDLLAGAVIGRAELIARIREMQGMLGGVAAPNTLYLLLRGLKTLGLRMARHNENGQRVAEFLERHPAVCRVWYPGLPSHPDHEVAARLMSGFGGVVSFELKTDLQGTAAFIDALKLPYMGPSLGGVESIVEQPALMSHFTLDEAEREALGIRGELVRYALGIEDTQDLIADLAQALERVPVKAHTLAEDGRP
ncbi:MAG: aminotransferase class I/II-fold pyridoxal phosphate-dependent enzyme [Chloroflexi bacterium]|nr:aminotransferase class I/II-fold pyridoxal phosphate-dependent enzyme [Chloroflexota bacterium]